jgi:hypothetical protein
MNTLVAVRPIFLAILLFGLANPAHAEPGRRNAARVISDDQIADAFEVDRFTVQQVRVPWGADLVLANGEVNIEAEVEGRQVTLSLHPHSMRGPDFQVLVQVDDGSLIEAPLLPITTWVVRSVER